MEQFSPRTQCSCVEVSDSTSQALRSPESGPLVTDTVVTELDINGLLLRLLRRGGDRLCPAASFAAGSQDGWASRRSLWMALSCLVLTWETEHASFCIRCSLGLEDWMQPWDVPLLASCVQGRIGTHLGGWGELFMKLFLSSLEEESIPGGGIDSWRRTLRCSTGLTSNTELMLCLSVFFFISLDCEPLKIRDCVLSLF